jgi:hypothetical protein
MNPDGSPGHPGQLAWRPQSPILGEEAAYLLIAGLPTAIAAG